MNVSMKYIMAVMLFAILLIAQGAFAGSLTFEVDCKGQTYDQIEVQAANMPREIDWNNEPAYLGVNTVFQVTGLTVGQTYQFKAVLRRDGEVSPESNVLKVKVQEVAQVVRLVAPELILLEGGEVR